FWRFSLTWLERIKKLHYRRNSRVLVLLPPKILHFCSFSLSFGFYLTDASRRGAGVKQAISGLAAVHSGIGANVKSRGAVR
ncbi:hypothetical protein, partial [Paenibacillus cisolokensis]|uniref:hypothetical protein n=1 Tax=Paenibacillus cisolokensis TaxID=1658519 RepID=UPI001BCD32DD